MKRLGIVLLTCAAALGASSAHAAVTVLGDPMAATCSQDALHERSDDVAIATCDTALEDETLDSRDRAGTYVNRGTLRMNRRDWVGARADFQSAIDADPSVGAGWANRGAVDIHDRLFAAAVDDLTKGLKLGVEQAARVYYDRAVAYEDIDDEKSAYFDYVEAAKLEPNWELPQHELLRFTVSPAAPLPTPPATTQAQSNTPATPAGATPVLSRSNSQ